MNNYTVQVTFKKTQILGSKLYKDLEIRGHRNSPSTPPPPINNTPFPKALHDVVQSSLDFYDHKFKPLGDYFVALYSPKYLDFSSLL